MKWEPIEAAPKDGRPLLLHNSGWQISVLIGGWDAREQAWRVYGFGRPASQPTDWQERPAPPNDDPCYTITEAGRRMLHEDNGA